MDQRCFLGVYESIEAPFLLLHCKKLGIEFSGLIKLLYQSV